jgi:hypothetical protein
MRPLKKVQNQLLAENVTDLHRKRKIEARIERRFPPKVQVVRIGGPVP